MSVLRQGLVRPESEPDQATRVVAALPHSLRRMAPSGTEKCHAEGHCRMCQRPGAVRQLTRHHVVPFAWWKKIALPWREVRNAPANIVPLCRPCHDLVESPDRAVREEARRMARRAMAQTEIAFAIGVRGKPWFDHHYPP